MQITWTGAVSRSFDDPANWDGNSVPSFDDVVLPDVAGGYTVTIAGNEVESTVLLNSTQADPITLNLIGGVLATNGLQQTGAAAVVQLSHGSTLEFITDIIPDPSPFSVQFTDGSNSVLIPDNFGFNTVHSSLDPNAYAGSIAGFGGRNTIQVSVIDASNFFAFAPTAGGGTLTVYQPGIDPYYQTHNMVVQTVPSAVLNFVGTYHQDDFRLGFGGQNGHGLLTYAAQTTNAHGANIVQGTAGDDTLQATGRYQSIYGNGGNDSFTLTGDNGQVMIGNSTSSVEHATLNGSRGFVQGSGGNVSVQAAGTSNTFILGDGSTSTARYDIIAAGSYNRFVLDDHATNTVVTGGDGANVAIGAAGDGASGSAQVTLGGANNVVNVGDGDAAITGGTGNAMLCLGAGNDTVSLGGTHNRVMLMGGNATISAGSGSDTIALDGTSAHLTLHGSNNMVFIGGPNSDSSQTTVIDGSLQGARIGLRNNIGTVDIIGFQSSQNFYLNLNPYSPFQISSDGAGGTLIAAQNGTVDFIGAANVTATVFNPNPPFFT